ncbi:zinc transport system substrate-binding protein [Roseimicrobium gellanilyticum]|uniref:Zinc transport system substrate-binding protein n=1 Tax=Roseimicrobium gellanilyticum TaxID=748857 RepID=A0A366HPY6_9BACT|nr:metal ABC transporter substrate-binding protein [Roseimicrobium gellanilyticum]RBP45712.1 zinc transport system substrate-binding protein [Roseimicrobium gellanilyticum]
MKPSSFLLLPLAITAVALTIGCKPTPPGKDDESKPKTQTSVSGLIQIQAANYPLAYFADRIGGPEVKVHFLAPADEDPAFWQPTEADIAALQKADLIVLNGATYSKWLDKVTLPESKTLDTSAGFKSNYIEVKEATTHSHGKTGEHSHAGIAFTTWIDFKQALKQADAIREELQRIRPEQIELFALNYDLLKKEIEALDAEMETIAKKIGSQPLVASHPVYQYWARRYALNLQAVHWEPETVPDDAAMADLQKILTTHPAKWMIWEGEPAKESVEKLKAIGVQSVVFDPCGNKPESGNWLDVMKANLAEMKKVAGE